MRRIPRLYLPMRKAEDVKPFLASPDHFRDEYSAKLLAQAWFKANKLPSKVEKVLQSPPRFANAELVDAFLERRTSLGDPWRPSQSDVLAIIGLGDELAVMTVEGKVQESFGPIVSEWNAGNTNDGAQDVSEEEPLEPSAKQKRLTHLKQTLGLEGTETNDLRYQLLHRTASAIYEAQRYRARVAVMMVHSFDPGHTGLSDFKLFASRMKLTGAGVNCLVGPVLREGVDLYLGWVADTPSKLRSDAR